MLALQHLQAHLALSTIRVWRSLKWLLLAEPHPLFLNQSVGCFTLSTVHLIFTFFSFYNMFARILITGSTGFIGSAFIAYVRSLQCSVRVVTRRPYLLSPLLSDVEVVYGDFLSTHDWSDAVRDVDVIINIAAELNNLSTINSVNFIGPSLLLKAAQHAGVKRWVQLSSVGAYGPLQRGLVCEDWPELPQNAYEVSKTRFDNHLISSSLNGQIEYCILRPSNVYGSNMRNQSLFKLLHSISNHTFFYIGPPGSSANYVHVDDVVHALVLSLFHPNARNKTFIVSSWAPFEDLVEGLALGFGLKIPKVRISILLARLLALPSKLFPSWPLSSSRIAAMTSRARYSTHSIEAELGWVPSRSVREGMTHYAIELKE